MKLKIQFNSKNELSQLMLICQNLSHETMMIVQKQIKINYEVLFSINLILKNKIENKNKLKKAWKNLAHMG